MSLLYLAIRREGVAARDLSRIQTGLKPLHALLRRSVGELLGTYVAGRHLLQPVVSHCGRRAQPSFDVRLMYDIALLGRVRPHAREAVRLQFQAYRQRIRLRWLALPHALYFALDAQQLLHVMSDLMRDHVGLGEFPGRSETAFQFVKKAQVGIHLFVFRTVERTGRTGSLSARGGIRIPEQHQLGLPVLTIALCREDGLPGRLHVLQHEGHELIFLVLGWLRRRIGCRGGLVRRRIAARKHGEEIPWEYDAQDQPENKSPDAPRR